MEKIEIDCDFIKVEKINDIDCVYHITSEGKLKAEWRSNFFVDEVEKEAKQAYIDKINLNESKVQQVSMVMLFDNELFHLDFIYENGSYFIINILHQEFDRLRIKHIAYVRDKTIDEVLTARSPFE